MSYGKGCGHDSLIYRYIGILAGFKFWKPYVADIYIRIPVSAAILSSTGGCVLKIFEMNLPASCGPKGFEIKRCAVA